MKTSRKDRHDDRPAEAERTWKEIEREGWNRNAPHYDVRAGRMTATAARPLLAAVHARRGMRLLDVCCGPGYGAGLAAEAGLMAVGIDLAAAMVREARERHVAAEFREGDAERLEFPDESFAAVICAFGLLHLMDPGRAIAEAFRVLAPGGRYAFTVWCQPEKARLLKLALEAVTSHADLSVPLPAAPPMFYYSDPAVTRAALEAAGFVAMEVEELSIDFVGRSPDGVFDWLDKSTVRTMALFRLQTPAVQARIRDAVLRGAEEFFDGTEVRIPCPALLYSARKP
jgi:ubiquinone/menaquinone biosynthesis C-methylase UbiE